MRTVIRAPSLIVAGGLLLAAVTVTNQFSCTGRYSDSLGCGNISAALDGWHIA